MSESVTFSNEPMATQCSGSGETHIRYNIDAHLHFPNGEFKQVGAQIEHPNADSAVIQLNVRKLGGNGSTEMPFRAEFTTECLAGKTLSIVVHDGDNALGETNGSHQEDCEEVVRPIPVDQ